MKITNIEIIENYDDYIYNFSVEDNHNYIVEDVVVSNCHYCYTSALKTGVNFNNIIDKANDVWGKLSLNDRPFQIAIGGAGEATMHPDFIEFIKTVRSLEIIPNYTTNGMHLSDDMLNATEKYCGGVALSWHPHIPKVFEKAANKLREIKTKLNFHIIVGSDESLLDLEKLYETYKDNVDYFVILPYQAVGRAKQIETEANWIKCFQWIQSKSNDRQKQFAFGALFYEFLKKNNILDIDVYEPEIYSGYRIMDDSYLKIRKSSYDLTFK